MSPRKDTVREAGAVDAPANAVKKVQSQPSNGSIVSQTIQQKGSAIAASKASQPDLSPLSRNVDEQLVRNPVSRRADDAPRINFQRDWTGNQSSPSRLISETPKISTEAAAAEINGKKLASKADILTEKGSIETATTGVSATQALRKPMKSLSIANGVAINQLQLHVEGIEKLHRELGGSTLIEGENLQIRDSKSFAINGPTAFHQVLAKTETPVMIGRQMAEVLQRIPDRPVELTLNPSELGRVRMSISAAETGIVVSVIAERPETSDLMRRNIGELESEFLALGYEDIEFAFAGRHENRNPDRSDRENSEMNLDSSEFQKPETGQQGPRSISTGLDLRL